MREKNCFIHGYLSSGFSTTTPWITDEAYLLKFMSSFSLQVTCHSNITPLWSPKYYISPVLSASTTIYIRSEKDKLWREWELTEMKEYVLGWCGGDNCYIPLVDPYIQPPPFHIQHLTFYNIVIIFLEFIIHLIWSTVTSLLIPKFYPFLWKVMGPLIKLT